MTVRLRGCPNDATGRGTVVVPGVDVREGPRAGSLRERSLEAPVSVAFCAYSERSRSRGVPATVTWPSSSCPADPQGSLGISTDRTARVRWKYRLRRRERASMHWLWRVARRDRKLFVLCNGARLTGGSVFWRACANWPSTPLQPSRSSTRMRVGLGALRTRPMVQTATRGKPRLASSRPSSSPVYVGRCQPKSWRECPSASFTMRKRRAV